VIRALTKHKPTWRKYQPLVPGMDRYLWPSAKPLECVACWFEATAEVGAKDAAQGRKHTCSEGAEKEGEAGGVDAGQPGRQG